MYVDYEFYTDEYGGSLLSEQDFAESVREAETYIRYLTYANGDIFADTAHADAVKRAVCAAADAQHAAVRELEAGGNVKSESKDGLSVSFVVARKDGENVYQYINRCMDGAARMHLLPTGWLSRKVRCGHGHECGRCDCL